MNIAEGPKPATITVLSGPSGSGKGTVIRQTIQQAHERSKQIWLSVSDTTRLPRANEQDGVHYNFISETEFSFRQAQDYYLESATYAGNSYGTPREAVLNKINTGVPVLIEIELQGARQIMAAVANGFRPRPFFVFLAPPSWEELVRRLSGRGTEGEGKIQSRLLIAKEEMTASDEYDTVIINDSVSRATAELYDILSR